ncbi:MAG: WD40 repeat domain-containing protein [Pirellulales bacterium]
MRRPWGCRKEQPTPTGQASEDSGLPVTRGKPPEQNVKGTPPTGLAPTTPKTDPELQPKPSDGSITKPKSSAREIKGVADKELFTLSTDDPVSGVAVSPDGTFVLAGSGKPGFHGQAQSWDARTGKPLQKFTGHSGHVTCVDIAPDSKTVATASWDGSVKWFDAQTGQCRATWQLAPANVQAVAFSHDGTRIAAGTSDFKLVLDPSASLQPGNVQIWSTNTQQPTFTLRGHDYFFNSLIFTSTSLIGTDAKVLIQWNIVTGQEEKRFALETLGGIGFHCCLAGDEATLAIYVEKKKSVVLLDLKTEKVLWSIPAEQNYPNSPLVFAPDGRTLAIGDKNGVVHLWDVTAKKDILTVKAHTEPVSGLAFSPNGELMVTGAASANIYASDNKGIVRIWKCHQE